MTIYVLILTVFFAGETGVYEYGRGGVTVEFPTKAACEAVKAREEVDVPKMLPQGAEMRSIRCAERQAKGGV